MKKEVKVKTVGDLVKRFPVQEGTKPTHRFNPKTKKIEKVKNEKE